MAAVADDESASISVERRDGGRLVVRLSGEFDIATVDTLRDEVEAIIESDASSVTVDMVGLEFMDSSGIAMLMRIAGRFGPIEVLNPTSIIRQIIEAVGIDEILVVREEGA